MVEINGICTNCGQVGKMHTCALCGSLVCCKCFNSRQGICQRCQKGLHFSEKSLK